MVLFAVVYVGVSQAVMALSPTRSQHSWVAGTGEAGNVDGPFMVASFNQPSGILFDSATNRLVIADDGNRSLRTVALGRQNSTDTLNLKEAGTGAAFQWVSPTCLAWKADGKLLYCLDKGKPGVAVVDLAAETGRWLPLPVSFTGKTGDPCYLQNAQALYSVPGQFAVLALGSPRSVVVFDLPQGNTIVCNLVGAPALDDLSSDSDGLWGIGRQANSLFRLAPANAPAGWFQNFAQTVTSTATCPDFLADTIVGGAVAHPWSFVQRGGYAPGLEVACDDPRIMAYRNAQGGFDTWCMMDQHSKKIGLENDNIYDEDYKLLKTRTQYFMTVGAKRLFRRPAYVCEDAQDERWYLSDTDSDRIVSFTRSEPDDPSTEVTYDGLMDTMFPAAKKDGLQRIAVFSSCYFKEVKDTRRKMETFSKRFQWYLNVFSSLKNGSPYEVMFFGDTLPPQECYLNLIHQRMSAAVGKYHCDEVLLALRPRDLCLGAIAGYQNYPIGKDGLPQEEFDPEYVNSQRTWADLSASPLYTDLVRYIVANQSRVYVAGIDKRAPALFLRDDEGNLPDIVKFDYQNKELLGKVFAIWTHDLGVMKQDMEAQAAADHRSVRITIALFPEHSTIGPQEVNSDDESTGSLALMRQSIKTMCGQLGIRYIDMVDEMRVFSLDSPWVEVSDGHPTQNGADLMGLLAAQKYLDSVPASQ